jgi:hypothetical protein
MDAIEVRMRCIEAISASGVREPSRLIKDAEVLLAWVEAARDNDTRPARQGRSQADKANAPA